MTDRSQPNLSIGVSIQTPGKMDSDHLSHRIFVHIFTCSKTEYSGLIVWGGRRCRDGWMIQMTGERRQLHKSLGRKGKNENDVLNFPTSIHVST